MENSAETNPPEIKYQVFVFDGISKRDEQEHCPKCGEVLNDDGKCPCGCELGDTDANTNS